VCCSEVRREFVRCCSSLESNVLFLLLKKFRNSNSFVINLLEPEFYI